MAGAARQTRAGRGSQLEGPLEMSTGALRLVFAPGEDRTPHAEQVLKPPPLRPVFAPGEDRDDGRFKPDVAPPIERGPAPATGRTASRRSSPCRTR
jgi:hypothetical protein